MAKRPKPEEIVAKLRQADVLISQGQSVAEAIRAIAVSEVPAGRTAQRRDLLHAQGGTDRDRELETPLQHGPAARIIGLPTASSGGVHACLHGLARRFGQAARGGAANRALTLNLGHPVGADQCACCRNDTFFRGY